MIYVRRQAPRPVHTMGTLPGMKPLSAIVGVDQQGGFGKDGKIPWYFSEDLEHFKATTQNAICIMGRKTYEDMLEMVKARQQKKKKIKHILPNRECIVLTRQADYEAEGATIASSLIDAITTLDPTDAREIFIIGGEKLYIEALPWVQNLHMTIVQDTYECDRFFPLQYVTDKFDIDNGHKGKDEKLLFVQYKRVRK